MAHPWVFQENFEGGDKGNFDGTSVDGGGALSFLHYTQLTKLANNPMPFRGAYLPQIEIADVDGSGTYLLENSAFDTSADITRHLRFYLFVTDDLTMAASDIFDILHIRSGSAAEVVVSIRNNSGVIEIGAGETAGSTRTTHLTLGKWHAIELSLAIDGAADGSGTIDFFVDGTQVGAQIGSLTQAQITNARFGVQGKDSGTTAGRLYFDQIVYDDARVYPIANRKPKNVIVTDDEHVFIGPGVIDGATLLTTGDSNTMHIYDTDTADANDASSRKVELDLETHTSWDGPIHFEKGCYVDLGGTNPRGQVVINTESLAGPIYYFDDGAMKNYGRDGRSR